MRNTYTLPLLLLALVPTAHADDVKAESKAQPLRYFVNALAGPSIGTTSPKAGATHFAYGVRAGAAVFEHAHGTFSLGASIQTLANSETTSGVTVNARITTVMLDAVTRHAFGTGFYAGGRFGLSFNGVDVSASGADVSASAVTYAVAPVVGYEIQVTPTVTAGLDVNWTVIGGSTFTFPNGARVETISQGMVMVLGGVTYSF